MDPGLAVEVPEFSIQPETVGHLGACLVVVGQPGAGRSEGSADHGPPGDVSEAGGGGQRDALDGCRLLPVPSPLEKVGHGQGQLPGTGIESGLGGQGYRREKHPVLGLEPVQCLLMIGVEVGRDAGHGGVRTVGSRDGLSKRVAA